MLKTLSEKTTTTHKGGGGGLLGGYCSAKASYHGNFQSSLSTRY